MRIINTAFAHCNVDQRQQRFQFKRQTQNAEQIQDLNHLVREKIKIAIVTETWMPEINGVSLSLLNICKGLQKKGHKILLIRPSQKEPCSEFVPNKECVVNGQAIPKYQQMQVGWPQCRKVSQAFDEFSPDLVHIVTEGPLGLAVLQVAKSKNISVTSGFHSSFQDFGRFYNLSFLIKPIQHYLKWFHNNTLVTCVPSQDTADAIRKFGVTCEIEVVKTGVDVESFSPNFRNQMLRRSWGACEQTTVMLYVGRLSQEKEIQLLIDGYVSAKQNPERKFKLVIVGDGPDRMRLENYAKAYDVVFTGMLRDMPLAEAFASADVFVFASQVETFGNVVLEAMASGLAVVAYDYACAKQYLDAETAWLAPLGKESQFIYFLKNLPNNQTLQCMGAKAQAKVQNVGWEHSVQQLEQLFYRVIQARPDQDFGRS